MSIQIWDSFEPMLTQRTLKIVRAYVNLSYMTV